MDDFLQQYSRRRHSIVGDGNCLFRSFSFILFEVESKHFDIRKLLVQFVSLNPSHFQPYCFPSTVEAHTDKMKNNHVWGTHVDIFALSLCFAIPVFVAILIKAIIISIIGLSTASLPPNKPIWFFQRTLISH